MRPQASVTFLKDENSLLWLGLLARDTGRPASDHLEIKDGATALAFNLAVSLRLFRFDNEKDQANRKFWIQMLGGKVDGDVLDASEIHDFVRNDPYADENTIIS